MKLTLTGLGIVAFTAVLLLPSSFSMQDTNSVEFWGASTLVTYDEEGNEVFAQTVHNRILDAGEEFILDQIFGDGAITLDAESIGTICVLVNGTSEVTVEEDKTALEFDEDNQGMSGDKKPCREDTTVTSGGGGTAQIGALTFTGNTNVKSPQTIHGIGICQLNNSGADFQRCRDAIGGDAGILFAIVDTSDVTLTGVETVDITYTFDISSPSN